MPKIDEYQDIMVLEGWALIERAHRAGHGINEVLTSTATETKVRDLLGDTATKIVPKSDQEISEIAGFPFHRGIIGFAPKPKARPLDQGLIHGDTRALVIPRLGDPANLGALSRSARAFGWQNLIIGPGCPDPYSRRVIRTSMGAILEQRLWWIQSPQDLALVGEHGWSIVGADANQGAMDLESWVESTQTTLQGLALVMGHEHEGLGAPWAGVCDTLVQISMIPGQDSLNVGAAGAIFLYRMGLTAKRTLPS